MIHVDRIAAPPSLKSLSVEQARKDAEKFFKTRVQKRKQRHHKFFPLTTKLTQFGDELVYAFDGKCAFCESYVSVSDFSYMDRFRPKAGAINSDGTSSPDHYWWLAYEWSNIYLVCLACNKVRGQRFPISGKRAKPGTIGDALRKELPMLLDTCDDFPEDHLVFDERGFVASDSKSGRTTIETFGLNRSTLVPSRAEVVATLKGRWQNAVSRGAEAFDSDLYEDLVSKYLSFLGLRRQCLQRWSSELVLAKPRLRKRVEAYLSFRTAVTQQISIAPPTSFDDISNKSVKAKQTALKKTFERFKKYQDTQNLYSVENEAQKDSYYLKARFVERNQIKNFKVIKDLDLEFPVDVQIQGSWLLFLGENGTGKSSVLAALTLALMGDKQRRSFLVQHKLRASNFVRFGTQSGEIKVYLTSSSEPIVLKFNRNSTHFSANSKAPKVLLLAYGATRLLPRESARSRVRKMSPSDGVSCKADNFFDPFSPLNDAEEWLWDLPSQDFDLVAKGLKQLLLLEKEELLKDKKKPGRILVKGYRSEVPLDEMSAGYQSVVALTADVMSVLWLRWKSMEHAEGIVLVDEIDSHLHPRWKMQIVPRLRAAFPRLQFIVTSHDPLCLRGLHGGEVVVMKRTERGVPIAITDLPAPNSLRVDQILTSEFFGLNSTVDPGLEQTFARYYKLLAIREPGVTQRAELEDLKVQLQSAQQMGVTRRERIMLEAADQFIAEQDTVSDSKSREDLRKETKEKILELWKTAKPAGGGVS